MICLPNLVSESGLDVNVESQTVGFLRATGSRCATSMSACGRRRVALYHMGFRCQTISRNTLANANATRPWQIYADFAQHLIGMARPLYALEPFGVELDAAVYAFDASTIDLCLSVFAWAPFRKTKAAIKLHTLLDLRSNIPSFVHITDRKTHEVNVLDDLVLEPGAFYLMDRDYLDFSRLFVIHEAGAFFVTRAKSNTHFKRRYSHPWIGPTRLCCATKQACSRPTMRARITPRRCAAWWSRTMRASPWSF